MAGEVILGSKEDIDALFKNLFSGSESLSKNEQRRFLYARQGLERGSVKNYQIAMINLFKGFTPAANVKFKYRNEIDNAWKIYQRMTGIYGKGQTEFEFFYIQGMLNRFDQDSVAPFYKEGDINLKKDGMVQSAQIKSSYGVFRLPKDIERIKRTTKARAKSLGIALDKVQENLLLWEKMIGVVPVFSKADTKAPFAKLDFMAQYYMISAAKWFLFVFTGSGMTVSVKAGELLMFVAIYEDCFEFIEDKDNPGEYVLQFDPHHEFQGADKVWKLILTEYFFPIHNIDDLHFYSRRGLIRGKGTGAYVYRKPSASSSNYQKSDILAYNANIKHSHFAVVHDTFFGGLKY